MSDKVERLAKELSECNSIELERIFMLLNEKHNIQKPKCVNCRFKKMYERKNQKSI